MLQVSELDTKLTVLRTVSGEKDQALQSAVQEVERLKASDQSDTASLQEANAELSAKLDDAEARLVEADTARELAENALGEMKSKVSSAASSVQSEEESYLLVEARDALADLRDSKRMAVCTPGPPYNPPPTRARSRLRCASHSKM